MASLLRKAARMNLVAMDFVLRVTVVELVLGNLDAGRMLSFELSRGSKTSSLPPKLVSATRSEWEQTMQVVLTLFLDKRSGRFQDKEYKLRLVQHGKDTSIIMSPALATFTLDASLYAHLGAGPSVEQPVDLYAPKLNGPGGFATVHLRVRCCEPGGGAPLGRSSPAPAATSRGQGAAPASGSGLPPRGPLAQTRPVLPPLQSGLLVGSSFGFSMSGSESRYSAVSTGTSAFSTPIVRRHGRPWSNEDLDVAGSAASMRSRSSIRSMRSKLGSKSFNDLDDSSQYTPRSSVANTRRGSRSLRSSMSFNAFLSSTAGSSAAGQDHRSPRRAVRRRARKPPSRLTTSESSLSGSSVAVAVRRGAAKTGPPPASILPYDRTTTVGYNRLLARFTKGPSPRGGRHAPAEAAADGSGGGAVESSNATANVSMRNIANNNGSVSTNASVLANKRRIFTFANAGTGPMIPLPFPLPGGAGSASVNPPANANLGAHDKSASKSAMGSASASSASMKSMASAASYLSSMSPQPPPAQQPPLVRRGGGSSKYAGGSSGKNGKSIRGTAAQAAAAGTGAASLGPGGSRAGEVIARPPLSVPPLIPPGGTSLSMGMGASIGDTHLKQQLQLQQQQRQQQQRHRLHRAGSARALPSLSISSFSSGWGTSKTPRVGPPGGGGGGQASAVRGGGVWRQQHSDESAGGGSAVAAPLSSATAGGGGVGGGGKGAGEEELAGMEHRVLHLEAALVRSELDLCRAKTDLAVARQEAHELQSAKGTEDLGGPTSADISALYHALEGSVVLLQIASEKMLHLEQTINRYRPIMPERVFNELQNCVTHDAVVVSPVPQQPLTQQQLIQQQQRQRQAV